MPHRRILACEWLVALATSAFAIFLPVHFAAMGIGSFEIGVAFSLLFLVAGIVGMAVGWLEEQFTSYRLLALSYGGYVLLPLFYFAVQNIVSLLAVAAYDGLVTAFRLGPLYSIFEGRSAQQTSVGVAHLEAGVHLAAFAGPPLAGLLLGAYGVPVFLGASAALMFIAFLLYPKHFTHPHPPSSVKLHSEWQFVEHDRTIHLLLAIMFLLSFVFFSKSMVIALFMQSLGYDLEAIGLVGGLFFIFLAISEWLAGILETPHSRRQAFSLGLLLAAVSIVLFGVFHSHVWQLAVLAAIFSLGVGLARPALFAFTISEHPAYRHFTTGALFTASRAGIVLGFLAGGFLIEQNVFHYFALAGAALGLAVILSRFIPPHRVLHNPPMPKKPLKKRSAHIIPRHGRRFRNVA